MPARLRLFGTERGAEGVDTPHRGGEGFAVQLSRLREIGRAFVEVIGAEQAGPLADGGGENGRVAADEITRVEEVVHRLFELVPHAHDGDLPLTAQPEGAVVEQEVNAVLLGLDRILVGTRADHLERLHTHLEPARRARVSADFPGERHRRFLRELGERIPRGFGHLGLYQHRLQNAGAIAGHDEGHLALGAQVGDPGANGDDGAGVVLEVGDADAGLVHRTAS